MSSKYISRQRVRLSKLDLRNLDLSGLGSDLDPKIADIFSFENTRMSGVNLSNSKLNHSVFDNSDIRGANLENASLKYCNLQGADMQYANIKNGDLSNSNLAGSNLSYIKIQNSNLSNISTRWCLSARD